ncbi:MAG: BACON domain-containing protein [Muribaculaceae bacterium]
MWKILISLATVVMMSLMVVSCGDDDELGFDKVSQSYADNGMNFDANGGTVSLTFLHPEGKTITVETMASGGDNSWISLAATPGSKSTRIVVGVTKNGTGKERRGGVIVRLDGSVWSVAVVQKAQ